MEKIVSPAIRCECCGNIKEYEKKIQVCDNCQKVIDWNSTSGYPFSIDPILHSDSIDSTDRFNFCSFECGLEWAAKTPTPLYDEDDFFSMYYHKDDWNKLRKILQKHFAQVTEGDKS